MDALHSIIQMPPGIPVATVGIDNAVGAAKLAVKMINCVCGRGVSKTEGATAPGGVGAGANAGAGAGAGETCSDARSGEAHSSDHADFTVKIVYDQEDMSEANLQLVTGALDTYGINYSLTDYPDLRDTDDAFLYLNLTGLNIEHDINNNKSTKGIPLIEVPQKATSGGFNDTSDKIYFLTKNSESAAFVGVASYQNAAHLIARIAGIHSPAIYDKVVSEHAKLAAAVVEKDARMRKEVSGGAGA